MADTDAVRGAGLADRLPAVPTASGPPAPAEPERVMTLVDHLTELRNRLIKAVVAIIAGTVIGFFVADGIKRILVAPLPSSSTSVLPESTNAAHVGCLFEVRT